MTALPSAPSRITEDQRKWLQAGLTQPGGKLPNFDALGARVADNVIDTCLQNGWAEQWMYNPLKPDWKVCRLTDAGRAYLDEVRPKHVVPPDAGVSEGIKHALKLLAKG